MDEVYLETGRETLPMPDELKLSGGQTKALQALTNECRGLAGRDLTRVVHSQLLDDADLTSAWFEIKARRVMAGDSDFENQVVFVQPGRAVWLLTHWETAPGSPDSQEGLQVLREQLRQIQLNPRQAGRILWPVHNAKADHWTLLSLYRRPQPDPAGAPFLWEVQYRDSLIVPAKSSQKIASAALTLLREVLGADQLAQNSLVSVPCAKQSGSTECGFMLMAWVEETVRLMRGEGVRRVNTSNFCQAAKRLTKWNQSAQAAWDKGKKKVKVEKPEVTAAPAVSSVGPTAISQAKGMPIVASQREESAYGCSRCRWAKAGCLSCSPAHMARYWHSKDSQTK